MSSGVFVRRTCATPVGEGRSRSMGKRSPNSHANLTFSRIDVFDDQTLDGPFAGDQVDRAPVGEPRHGRARDAPERRGVVERGCEQSTRLREEDEALVRHLCGIASPPFLFEEPFPFTLGGLALREVEHIGDRLEGVGRDHREPDEHLDAASVLAEVLLLVRR